MSNIDLHPQPTLLRRFHGLDDLSNEQLELLAKSLLIRTARKGKILVKRGATEAFSLLLLSGELELMAADGRRQYVQAGSDSAMSPIAHLLPRQFEVTATSAVAYLEIDTHLLDQLRQSARQDAEASQLVVEHMEDEEPSSESSVARPVETHLAERMRRDLDQDCLVLPSLPEIAVRIGYALRDDETDIPRIATLIQSDPAITAKIIKAANSAYYGVRQRAVTCAEAISRLGFTTTHKLVLSFALREVFRARSPLLNRRMRELWRHSTKVAAICYVLARITHRHFDPEHAMLVGLVHDIGEVAVLSYADRFPELARDGAHIDQAIARMRGEVGAMILKRWEFPEEFCVAAREAEDWRRDPAPEADYCDLLIVAQLHSYVGSPRIQELPHLGEVPCFKKLELGELTPKLSLKILDKAQDQLARAEALLGL